MLTMSQINHIKDLSNCGYCISEISEKLVLIWDPGPAQVDFGEADFYEAGNVYCNFCHYLKKYPEFDSYFRKGRTS